MSKLIELFVRKRDGLLSKRDGLPVFQEENGREFIGLGYKGVLTLGDSYRKIYFDRFAEPRLKAYEISIHGSKKQNRLFEADWKEINSHFRVLTNSVKEKGIIIRLRTKTIYTPLIVERIDLKESKILETAYCDQHPDYLLYLDEGQDIAVKTFGGWFKVANIQGNIFITEDEERLLSTDDYKIEYSEEECVYLSVV